MASALTLPIRHPRQLHAQPVGKLLFRQFVHIAPTDEAFNNPLEVSDFTPQGFNIVRHTRSSARGVLVVK